MEELVKEKPIDSEVYEISNGDNSQLISGSYEVRMSVKGAIFLQFQCWIKVSNDSTDSADAKYQQSEPFGKVEKHCQKLQERQGSDTNVQEMQPGHSRTNPLVAMDMSLQDGYNWRKYGQKHMKGSVFPRCYYKCKYPNCHVKKHFECSKDGQITDVVYKGKHNHPETQSRHRMSIGSTTSVQQEKSDRHSSFDNVKVEEKSSNSHGQASQSKRPCVIPEFSSVAANDGNVDGEDAELEGKGDEFVDPESKQRKREIEDIKVSTMDKPVREPRVIVQTPSEVDVLDDGYRWCKYGQKVVKGNPNPRSYYKCTNPRCPVRKHVERASNDRKAVITTYEGKHNHDVPSSAKITSNENEKMCPAVHISASKGMLMTESNDAISVDLSVGLTSTPADTTIHLQQDCGMINKEKRKKVGC